MSAAPSNPATPVRYGACQYTDARPGPFTVLAVAGERTGDARPGPASLRPRLTAGTERGGEGVGFAHFDDRDGSRLQVPKGGVAPGVMCIDRPRTCCGSSAGPQGAEPVQAESWSARQHITGAPDISGEPRSICVLTSAEALQRPIPPCRCHFVARAGGWTRLKQLNPYIHRYPMYLVVYISCERFVPQSQPRGRRRGA